MTVLSFFLPSGHQRGETAAGQFSTTVHNQNLPSLECMHFERTPTGEDCLQGLGVLTGVLVGDASRQLTNAIPLSRDSWEKYLRDLRSSKEPTNHPRRWKICYNLSVPTSDDNFTNQGRFLLEIPGGWGGPRVASKGSRFRKWEKLNLLPPPHPPPEVLQPDAGSVWEDGQVSCS